MHRVIGERDPSSVDEELARSLLGGMVRARVFDERAFALQRQGWMSGYPPFRGQEASQVGAATALADDDWLVPTYRANAMQLARGVPMVDILRFRRGYPEFGSGHGVPVLPEAVPIASQIPHATGLGMAANYRDTDEAVDRALSDARAGAPVLVESLTHRDGPHTTSDDPDRYDDRAAFPEWRTRDPIERAVEYFRAGGHVESGFVESVRETAEADFDAAREEAEAAEPDPDDLFDHVYEEPTPALEQQRAALEDRLRRLGDPYE